MSYRTGAYLIDPAAYEIRREGQLVPVEPQVLELLVFLMENRDRTVTKDELIERVWKGRIVSGATLSSRIKAARQALGDDGTAQRLIRTVHGRGFRFVGDVRAADAPEAAAAGPTEVDLVKPDAGHKLPTSQSKEPVSQLPGTGSLGIPAGTRTRLVIAAACVALVGTAYLVSRLITYQVGDGDGLNIPPGGNAFDGRWRVENTGNVHCFHKQNVFFWNIAHGRLRHGGKGEGSVAATGELSFRRPGGRDPSRMVVFSGRLERDEGTGTYFQEGSKCVGTIKMKRLARPDDAASGQEKHRPQPRPTFKDCDVCPVMAALPEGYFMMGSPPDEEGRSLAEGPQRVVRFAKPFAIGRFEVAIDEFAAFVDETATSRSEAFASPSRLAAKPHTMLPPASGGLEAHFTQSGQAQDAGPASGANSATTCS